MFADLPANIVAILRRCSYNNLHDVLLDTEGKLKNIRRIPTVGLKKSRLIKAALDEIGS